MAFNTEGDLVAALADYLEIGCSSGVSESRGETDLDGEAHFGWNASSIGGESKKLLVEISLSSQTYDVKLCGYFRTVFDY
jgi:hypothetical protein